MATAISAGLDPSFALVPNIANLPEKTPMAEEYGRPHCRDVTGFLLICHDSLL
jgi:hypothetical protein